MLILFFFKETHIIHKFPGDLYGRNLKVAILGFLRPETNFKSLGKIYILPYYLFF